jgi:hypothetical protein
MAGKTSWKSEKVQIQLGRSVQKDIDALVRNGGRGRINQRPENFQSWSTRAGIPDAGQPRVHIESGVRHWKPPVLRTSIMPRLRVDAK